MQIVHNSTAYEIANRFARQAATSAHEALDAIDHAAPRPTIVAALDDAAQGARDAEYALKYVQGTMDAGAWLPAGKADVSEGVGQLKAARIRVEPGADFDGLTARDYLCEAATSLDRAVQSTASAHAGAVREEAGAANAVAALDAATRA